MAGEKLLLFLSLYAFCLVINGVHGSAIKFTASTDVVKDGLTDHLTLRCSLNDTTASSAVIGKRDVTQTAENVAEVTTIVLMRNGQDIASISRSSNAQVMDGSANAQVSGSIAGHSGDQAFLELTFQNPLKSQMGEFVCEINAVRVAHMVTFSTSLEVSTDTPTMADLIQSIQSMKINERAMTQTIANLTNTISQLKQKSDTEIFFSAGISKDETFRNGNPVIYNKVYANMGGDYDPTTGLFTCSVPGYYHFEMSGMTSANRQFRLRLYQNNQKDFSIAVMHSYDTASNSGILKLAKGDIVKVVSESTSSSSYLHSYAGGVYTTFNGQLVSHT